MAAFRQVATWGGCPDHHEEELMKDVKATKPDCDEPWVGDLGNLVEFAERGIVSKTLVDCPKVKIVHFTMKTGQSISGHSAGTPASIQVLAGAGTVQLGETEHEGKPGSIYYMPAGLYHALTSTDDLVFLLQLYR
jgi:quercetin dioxygenase-like cupin family protein